MSRTRRLTPALGLIGLAGLLSVVCMAGCAINPRGASVIAVTPTNAPQYVWAKAHHIPPETTTAEKKSGQWGIYAGGYVMTYDPATGQAEKLGQSLPKDDRRLRAWPDPRRHGEGVQDVTADETHGLLYVVTTIGGYWMCGELAHPEKGFRILGNEYGEARSRSGFKRLSDGALMPTDNILALHAARDGTLYATVLYPFTLLRLERQP